MQFLGKLEPIFNGVPNWLHWLEKPLWIFVPPPPHPRPFSPIVHLNPVRSVTKKEGRQTFVDKKAGRPTCKAFPTICNNRLPAFKDLFTLDLSMPWRHRATFSNFQQNLGRNVTCAKFLCKTFHLAQPAGLVLKMMIVPIVVVPADDHEDHDNHDRHDDHDELGQVKMMIVSCFNMFLFPI